MSPISNYEDFDALGLAACVANGEATPDELLEEALERTRRLNPTLNAIVIPMEEEARKSIEQGLPDGPFRGVPFLLKDLHILYAGVRTTSGCRLNRDFVADHDSELVARYRRAGLVIFGKTASPELGLSTSTESTLFGQTRNPWKLSHSSGGSSGGSSSAVAAGIVPAANASDGGGSIRIPASACGLYGLKPTRARTPFGPDSGEGWSGMSCMHAVTRSVRDSAALLDATEGADVGAPYWAPPPERPYLEEVGSDPGRLRIAVRHETWNGAPLEPDCRAALEDAVTLLQDLGHEVRESTLEIDPNLLGPATTTIMSANLRASLHDSAAALGRELADDDIEAITKVMIDSVASRGADDYARSLKVIHATGRTVEAFFRGPERPVDLILSPTMATPPLPLGVLSLATNDLAEYGRRVIQTIGYTQLWNATGHPAASLPLYWSDDGLPIGVQLAGRFGDEATLFRISAQLETARPWFGRRPPPQSDA